MPNPFGLLGNLGSKGAAKATAAAAVPSGTAAAAAAVKPGSWKRKLMGLGLVGATGWVANDAVKAFNAPPAMAPPQAPPMPQQGFDNRVASERLMDELEKTARNFNYKEATQMSLMDRLAKTASNGLSRETGTIMDRLTKTANEMMAIHNIANAMGLHPEEVLQLAQEDPDTFAAIHEQVNGGGQASAAPAAAGDGDADDMPAGAAAPAAMGDGDADDVPAGAAAPIAQAAPVDPAAQAAPVDPATQATPTDPAAQVVPVDPAAQAAPADPAAQAAPGADQGALLQAVAQAAAQGAAQGVQEAVSAMNQPQENPRSGAGSVSSNPAGVDKTASSQDLLVARLEKTVDALGDVTKAMRVPGAEDDDGTEKKAAELMASLEKTAAGIGGALKGFGQMVAGAGKKYVGNVTGKTHSAATEAFDLNNSPKGLVTNAGNDSVGVSKYRNHLDTLQANVDTAKKSMNNARIGTGLAVGGGLLATNHDKSAAEVAAEQEKTAAPSSSPSLAGYAAYKETPASKVEPAKVDGPAGQVGLEGYSEGSVAKTASEKEEFMNGIYKEAAAHIIEAEIPKVKRYVDPMTRIRF